MQVSLSWLSTHLDLSSYTVPQLSDLLTFAGVEVEGIEERGVTTDKVVVAQIESFVQHPNADKLSVCQVNDGTGIRQIVCGAKNFKAGDKVPLALPGAVLPGGFTIKEGKLRDVASLGMMCSGKELGLGEDHSGLLILDAETTIGTPFNQLVPSDVVFDLEITPNRPDLLSHLGLARELSALTGMPLKGQRDYNKTSTPTKLETLNLKLETPSACPLYTARLIKGVKVGPSPEWLRRRLESIGLRPINSIVDITNFVMMEMGQSLHCFDLDKLSGSIVVRNASEGEQMLALDGQSYTLLADDLVIADQKRAVAIAGVMGGEETGVTEATTNVLLEAAWFTPSNIRRTSRRLGLSSDSSYRFERGIDPQQVAGGSELATKLILSIAGGTAEDVLHVAGEAPALTGEVTLDEDRARKLLGTPDLTGDEIHAILEKLGLGKKAATKHESRWHIPSYRADLQRPVDLIEEIARVIGLDRVPSKMTAVAVPSDATDRAYDFAMTIRQALVNRGCFEAQTLRLIADAQLPDTLGGGTGVAVKNPLSEDHTTLRPSIIPGLIATAALNIRQGADRLRFFELGRVFLKLPNGNSREEERLAILISGPVSPSSWHARTPQAADIHELMGIITHLPGLSRVSIEPKAVKESPANFLLTSELRAGNRNLGWIAQLHPSRARDISARHPVYVAELLLSALRQGSTGPAKFEELPRFPGMTRDVAMEVPADLPHAKVAAFFASQKEPLFIASEVFDVFTDPTGQKIAKDRKSIAWTLTYRSPEKTLETAEVDAAHQRILAALEKALPATVRR
ncbi:MAG: phenylalanine--tRNA ligase subunit beta [Prosthecobacter sp.]|jgi:phenylalanyl-tRNA synthetase beta chain|uniref:phenylalanine--tRNA ligase subunit beta n=1 Tax=Prosthecobacter sp. TaxID=1965333 RepID=UPI0019F04E1A|nr:phenylalanine--tRNA ligase subunit beta [Prosthecobacter sp.]MBE2287237.1 phenylalanine--tRNA ligase subunit beta [Prosthecobacter sp.]